MISRFMKNVRSIATFFHYATRRALIQKKITALMKINMKAYFNAADGVETQ